MNDRYAERTVGQFLDALAARRPAPSAGAALALTGAAAAGLAAMAARYAVPGDPVPFGAAERADELREQLTVLADADTRAYAGVLAVARLPASDPARSERRTAALTAATEVPLEIAAAAAELATLAARLADAGNPALAGDAWAAVRLAEAAARAAADLVRINVAHGALPAALVTVAERHARTAAGALPDGA